MGIKDQLKASDCKLCRAAFDEIIRLEATIINKERWINRLSHNREGPMFKDGALKGGEIGSA